MYQRRTYVPSDTPPPSPVQTQNPHAVPIARESPPILDDDIDDLVDDNIDDLVDDNDTPPRRRAAPQAADRWGEVGALTWPLVSDRAVSAADIADLRRQIETRGNPRTLGAWMRDQASILVAMGAVETEKDGLAIVALGREYFGSVAADPSLADYLLTEQQRPGLLEQLLN
jgi:hypothetical protein